MSARRLELPVTAELAGIKVDTLLKRHLHLSGTVVRRVKWLPDGILVDGVRVNTRFCPKEGQVLSVRLSDPERRSGIVPAPGPLDIVWEDEDLLVLNKAPGVPVHPGPGHFDDTICNFLLNYYDSRGIEGDAHPVHRLDRGTSGLLVVAKHPHAQEVLKNQLHTSEFRRIYLAVCLGGPADERGTVDAPIGMAEGSIVARAVRPDGLPAQTHYRVLERRGTVPWCGWSWRRGGPTRSGSIWPIWAVPWRGLLYGTEDRDLIPRPALHSSELAVRQPVTGERLTFTCPLPADMARLMKPET